MADDPKDQNPNPPDAEGASGADTGKEEQHGQGSQTGDQGQDTGDKTYTQAELDAIVNARISKAQKQAKKQAEEELKKERERQDMDEVERTKAEKAEADKRIAELEERVRQSRIREQLAGKVVNLDDAVKVLDDDFVNEDGTVDVEKFLESRPYFRAPTQQGGRQASPGNPPSSKRLTREQIANMTEKEIEDRWDEVQEVLGASRS